MTKEVETIALLRRSSSILYPESVVTPMRISILGAMMIVWLAGKPFVTRHSRPPGIQLQTPLWSGHRHSWAPHMKIPAGRSRKTCPSVQELGAGSAALGFRLPQANR
jgi:hypothetical protein